ncbi:Ricin-type beta-trefoil lectin domain protein [compost metagenome]
MRNANEATDQKWVFVPTGDEAGSYSIRTTAGQALDLDTGQNRIQLYSYLGYNNQRWIIRKNEDGSAAIISAHQHLALAISGDGSKLTLEEYRTDEMRQKWRINPDSHGSFKGSEEIRPSAE